MILGILGPPVPLIALFADLVFLSICDDTTLPPSSDIYTICASYEMDFPSPLTGVFPSVWLVCLPGVDFLGLGCVHRQKRGVAFSFRVLRVGREDEGTLS